MLSAARQRFMLKTADLEDSSGNIYFKKPFLFLNGHCRKSGIRIISCIRFTGWAILQLLILKVDLIRMCSFISEKEVALENLKNIVKEAIVHIINKIKEKFESNEFKKDEIKRLEHIIITDCKGNEKIASDIMTQILSQGIIYNNGMFNSNLFKKQQNNIKENDKIDKYGNRNRDSKKKKNDKDKDGKIAYKEKKQNVKIYYNKSYFKHKIH